MNKRIKIEAIDNIIGNSIPVLDKGFIRVIDYMGGDSSVVQAARVSYGAGTKTISADAGLINYLMRHRHSSPFEMCEIKLHLKMPIFVARQWIRHRTANINEMSARYSIVKDEFYLPETSDICLQSSDNKQARGLSISENSANSIRDKIDKHCLEAFLEYRNFLDNENVAREIARIVLPQAAYTEFYWKIDLHNLLHFLFLRSGSGAQMEISLYAKIILEIVQKWTPLTYSAFVKYRINGMEFSDTDVTELAKLMDCEKVSNFIREHCNKNGEKRELADKLSKCMNRI